MPYCKKNNNLLDVDSINNPNQDCFAQDSAVGGGGAKPHIHKIRQAA